MIISSISYKGGVGKSTLAQNLAVALALDNYKVCIIDADESAATTRWFAIRHQHGRLADKHRPGQRGDARTARAQGGRRGAQAEERSALWRRAAVSGGSANAAASG